MGILYKTNKKNLKANSRGTVFKKIGVGDINVLGFISTKKGARNVEAIKIGKNYEIYLRTSKKAKRKK